MFQLENSSESMPVLKLDKLRESLLMNLVSQNTIGLVL